MKNLAEGTYTLILNSYWNSGTGGDYEIAVFCGLDASYPSVLNNSEKDRILDAHNARRERAAAGNEQCAIESCPTATNMNALRWDDGLEAASTLWAHQLLRNKLCS